MEAFMLSLLTNYLYSVFYAHIYLQLHNTTHEMLDLNFFYLLQLLLVLIPMKLLHVSLLHFDVGEGDEALETL